MIREISPEHFNHLVALEREFAHTIDNKYTLEQMADKGVSKIPKGSYKMIRLALEGNITPDDIFLEKWELPAGAFQGSGGGSF